MTYCSNAESIGRLVTSAKHLAVEFVVYMLEKQELRYSGCPIPLDSTQWSYCPVVAEIIQLSPFALHGFCWTG